MTASRWLFGGTVFLASFFLFLAEPMVAKQLLPVLGGSSAVWITCLVFFQTALLLAYLYAHWLTRHPHWSLHVVLLVLGSASAVAWAARSTLAGFGSEHPVPTVFAALGASIGLPFLALAATSPLLQVWWARVHGEGIPYRLYALSNLASLLALALYPAWIEPALTLHAQRMVFCCGFGFFAVPCAWLAWRTRAAAGGPEQTAAGDDPAAPAAPIGHKVLWVLLPVGGAMQLCAVTRYLTANIAAVPLLWILPLGVYLITLILAFEIPHLLPQSIITRFLVVMLAALGYWLTNVDASLPVRVSIVFFLSELFIACIFCHSATYALRPRRASESTVFYLLFAAGGALGTFLIAIVSPLIFSFNYDLAITFFVTALLALAVTWRSGWSQRSLWCAASALMAGLVVTTHLTYERNTQFAVRNFYAALRVSQNYSSYPGATVRTLTNGIIQHGTQIFGTDPLRHIPTTYYARDSGVGLALQFCCQGRPMRIGVIGLGAGTLAAYGRPGDRMVFYEINPAVVPIADNLFTYLRDSGAQISIVEGDARTSLAQEPPQHFDVLAIDAFSGDAIPLHLLTAQALALYRRHLAPGGILAFHISNNYVDLGPPIALLARDAGMEAMRVSSPPNDGRGEFTATWMLVSDNRAFFKLPQVAAHVHEPALRPGLRLWTDDYSSLLPLIRW